MKSRRIVFAIFILFVCSTWACVVSESFKIGQEMAKEKRWDEAIAYYEKALKESPDNSDYKSALAAAKQESAKVHYERAKNAASKLSQQDLPGIERVMKEADKAYELDPQNAEISAFHAGLVKKKNDLQATIKSLYAQAETDLKKEDWPAAISSLKKINEIFPSYEDIGDKLALAYQQSAKLNYRMGVELSKKEDWKGAAKAFKAVLDVTPNYFDTQKLYSEAKSKDSIDYFLGEATRAEASKNLERAILMYEKALEYDPARSDIKNRLNSDMEKAGQDCFDDAMKSIKAGRLGRASQKLQAAKTYSPSIQQNLLYREISSSLIAKLMTRADAYSEKGKWANALVWYQKVEAIDPNYANIFFKVQETKDNIKKRIRKSIAVFDFKSPSNNKDAGKIIASKLITYLYRNASGDVRIIERENLESILKELQLGQTGLVDVDTVQKVGKMGGIDTFIMGDVLRFSTEYKDYPSNNQVKVLVDEEDVHNPAFSDWLLAHPKPTEDDMKNAPPRTIKKKNYQFVSYKSGYARVSTSLETSYKLIDTRSGENLFANTVSGKLAKESKYQDGVPLANIPHIQLEIPTELDVLDELTNAKVTEMGQSILKHFQNLEIEYFNAGQQQNKRRNGEEAVERFTDAIFDESLKSIKTPVTRNSLEMIEALTSDI